MNEELIESVLLDSQQEFERQEGFELTDAWRWWPSHDHPERVRQDITYLELPQ